jgi:hypothetical protein
MTTFLYRCPNTEKPVQGWTADEVVGDGNTYISVQCLACRQLHYVNPSTGKVLGAGDND